MGTPVFVFLHLLMSSSAHLVAVERNYMFLPPGRFPTSDECSGAHVDNHFKFDSFDLVAMAEKTG